MVVESSYIEINKYGGIALDIYNGSYQIVQCYRDESGEIISRWAHPRKNREPIDKFIPLGVPLGDNGQSAVNAMKTLIESIHNEGGVPVDSGLVDDMPEDDIPF